MCQIFVNPEKQGLGEAWTPGQGSGDLASVGSAPGRAGGQWCVEGPRAEADCPSRGVSRQ